MNYLQKKKEAIIMMLAAQIIKTAKGYPVTVNDCESGVAVDYTVFGNTVTGKNLFDTQGWYNWLRTFTTTYVTKTEVDGVSCIFYRPNVTYDKQYMKGQFKENTQYTISFRAKGIVGTGVSTGFKFVHTDGTYNIKAVANKVEWDSYTLVSSANKTVDHIEMVYNYAQGCYFDENSIQLEEGAAATEYEPYSESYAGDKTKNLIPYPYYESTKTVNGITFTNNGDGTITANGTATKLTVYKILPSNPETFVDYPAGKYIFSGCPSGGSLSTYCINFAASSTFTGYDDIMDANDIGAGKLCSAPNGMKRIFAKIIINPNTVCNNLVFKPQLELGTTATEYEPYGYKIPIVNSSEDESRDNAVIDIYLDEPLKQGESVNFGADNLPELQLFEGSNIITADTEVKPEKIVIDYYEKG